MDVWSMEMKELFLWSMLPMELSENTWIVSSSQALFVCVRVCARAHPCVLDVVDEDIRLQMWEFCWFTNDIDAGIHGNFIDLAVRLDIAIDVAHAITYLHMYTGFLLIATNLILLVSKF